MMRCQAAKSKISHQKNDEPFRAHSPRETALVFAALATIHFEPIHFRARFLGHAERHRSWS
jgi:hypothetical protein